MKKDKIKNEAAVAMGKLSAKAREKKLGRMGFLLALSEAGKKGAKNRWAKKDIPKTNA